MTLVCLSSPASSLAEVIVRMETNLGDIDIELYDQAAPITVTNFLAYVRGGDYNQTIIQRSEPGFVIQGGGYRIYNGFYLRVPADPPIQNEFDPSRSNLRGTIAMAKLGGDPDSATSEWFFNVADNSANLDFQNGGFTVFGQVLGDGMDVVDAINNLDLWDMSYLSPLYGGAFTSMPLIGFTLGDTFDPQQHHVYVNRVREILNVNEGNALVLGAADNVIALATIAPATFANVSSTANPSTGSLPDGVVFREGFFSFEIHDIPAGGSVQVAMQLPTDFLPNTYYMYGPTPDNPTAHWYEFIYNGRTGAEFFGNNFLVLHFVDGERGDADLTANGVILDPGGPGIAATTASSSGGGCTLTNTPAGPSSRMDLWLLTLLLAVRFLLRKRRFGV